MRAIRKGYADTPLGQLHWRANASVAPDIVFLHWAPGSGRMYEPVIEALAERGINSLAFDLPGYGASLRPMGMMSAPDTALCLAAGLAELTDRQVSVVGGHLSVECAIEWAINSPHQISSLVLDGVYALDESECRPLLAPYEGLSPRLSRDGTHETFLWRATCAVREEWDPHFEPSSEVMESIYATMSDYLQMGYPAILGWMESSKTAPGLGILERVRIVPQPILVLTAEAEPLRSAFARTVEACPTPPQTHVFPGVHPLATGSNGADYAEVIARFAMTARDKHH